MTTDFHKQNLRYAAAMEKGRKQILYALCGSQAALKILAQDYSAIKPSEKPLDELVHVHAHRFADDASIGEKMIRSRAERIAKRCEELSELRTVSLVDRKQLVDEMYDIRLPDSQMATVPDRALKAEFFDGAHANMLELLIYAPKRRVTEARTQLTETNLSLLKRPLYVYHERSDFEDIQSESALGLMAAADRWDPKSRMRFSTYAVTYIKGYANRWIEDNGSTIRVPVNKHAELTKLQKAEISYLAQHGEIPSAQIIADALGTKPKKVEILRMIRQDDRPYEHRELYDAVWRGPPRARELRSLETTDEGFDQKERQTCIQRLLKILTPQEKLITILRFGLKDRGEGQTLDEIADSLQLTRDQTRLIAEKALRKLRHSSDAHHLVPFASEEVRTETREAKRRAAEEREANQAAWIAEAKTLKEQTAERERKFYAAQVEAGARQATREALLAASRAEIQAKQEAARMETQALREAARAETQTQRKADEHAEFEQLLEDLDDPHVQQMLDDPRVGHRKSTNISDKDTLVNELGHNPLPHRKKALRGADEEEEMECENAWLEADYLEEEFGFQLKDLSDPRVRKLLEEPRMIQRGLITFRLEKLIQELGVSGTEEDEFGELAQWDFQKLLDLKDDLDDPFSDVSKSIDVADEITDEDVENLTSKVRKEIGIRKLELTLAQPDVNWSDLRRPRSGSPSLDF